MINKKTIMKALFTGLFLVILGSQLTFAQNPVTQTFTKEEQEIVALSRDKWQWMADKNVEPLNDLFMKKPCSYTWEDHGAKPVKLTLSRAAGYGIKKLTFMK